MSCTCIVVVTSATVAYVTRLQSDDERCAVLLTFEDREALADLSSLDSSHLLPRWRAPNSFPCAEHRPMNPGRKGQSLWRRARREGRGVRLSNGRFDV